MAKMNLKKVVKKAGVTAKAAAGTAVSEFGLVDDGNNNYTVVGVDAAGNQTDIGDVANLTSTPPVTSDPAVMTAKATGGMKFNVAAATSPAPAVGATATITLTAVWNDGSRGPFTATIRGTIQAGAIVGIEVV